MQRKKWKTFQILSFYTYSEIGIFRKRADNILDKEEFLLHKTWLKLCKFSLFAGLWKWTQGNDQIYLKKISLAQKMVIVFSSIIFPQKELSFFVQQFYIASIFFMTASHF